ncbi:MAG: UDP-N-acetylmuramoyl-tripeptide--D-alanyl-D-alanine ligase, partial [Oscillospiraceae bacterium]|nr:UDP-N-acetylmuramoyl-tripeptide--D-alanyl-D-alanine ligase [Oscillospiraceae bacterium]
LGRNSESFHREIGVLAGRCGIDALICCGDAANGYYKGLISSGSELQAWHFPMKDALLSVLPRLIQKGDTVLVKASHSMGFDEITSELTQLK